MMDLDVVKVRLRWGGGDRPARARDPHLRLRDLVEGDVH